MNLRQSPFTTKGLSMSLILVAYDKHPGRDYAELLAALRAYRTYWNHLDSFWLINTDEAAEQIRDALWILMDSNDELLVMDISVTAAAWEGINDSGSKWLEKYFTG